MQQDVEDKENEIVIKGFEDKIKKLEDSLKEKGQPAAFSRRLARRSAFSE